MDEVEFWVHEISDDAPLGTSVIGKVFRGSLRVGDVLSRVVVNNVSHVVSLRVEEIAMYEVAVDELDTGLSGRILVTGAESVLCDMTPCYTTTDQFTHN